MHLSRAAAARTRPLWPAPLAGLAALVLYARTLAPGLTWAHHAADGGDLLAAALTVGVPHPSGYPIYQLLLRAVITLFPGEPARAGNWLSALCAAAAVALFADLAGRMLVQMGSGGGAPGVAGGGDPRGDTAGAGAAANAGPAGAEAARLSRCKPVETGSMAARGAPKSLSEKHPASHPEPVEGWLAPVHARTLRRAQDAPTIIRIDSNRLAAGLHLLSQRVSTPGDPGSTTVRSAVSGLAALAAALTWAASPIFWGQAVVTEVYALNALGVVALLWLLWRWREAVNARARGAGKWPEGWTWLAGAGAVLGLGLGNHLTLLLMLPGAAIWLGAGRRVAGRPLARELLVTLAAVVVGLTVYAYLPLAAAANPPVNWGDPRQPAQLWALISGQVYRGLLFGLPIAYLPGRLIAWSGEALRQFGGPWGVILALIGLWQLDRRLHAWWQATLLIAAAYSVYAIGYNTPDSFVYLIPASCVAALWLAAGLAWLGEIAAAAILRAEAHTARRAPRRENGTQTSQIAQMFWRLSAFNSGHLRSILRAILAILLLAVPAISAARFWRENDLSHDREAQVFVTNVLADAAPDAIILTSADGPTFALWYAVYGLGLRPDVAPVNVNLVAFDWYRRALAQRHPDLAARLRTFDPAQPAASLTALAARRPLYRAETLNVPLPGYTEQPAGSLVRLIRDPSE